MTEQRLVSVGRGGDAADGLLGNDEDVRRRLGVHVVKRQDRVVLEDNLCRDLFPDNLAEDGVPADGGGLRLFDLGHGRHDDDSLAPAHAAAEDQHEQHRPRRRRQAVVRRRSCFGRSFSRGARPAARSERQTRHH